MPGPVPKRADQRRRVNKPAIPERKGQAQPFVECPPPREDWHRYAAEWYAALPLSGQSVWYEPSDWVTAQAAASLLSDLYTNGFQVASQVMAFHSMCQELLVTEGARRRARVELHRDTDGAGQAPPPAGSKKRDRSLLEAV